MDTARKKRAALSKLRDLQGLPLAILFAMLIERKPVTKNFLAMVLQRDKKTVGKAVDFLEFEGYVQRVHYRAWALPNGQLRLPGFEIGLLNAAPPALPVEHRPLPSGQDQMDGETGVETAASERGKNPLSDVRDAGAETSARLRQSSVEPSVEPSNDEIEATLRGIRVNGRAIGRNMWPKILACEHVTPTTWERWRLWSTGTRSPSTATPAFSSTVF